MKESSVKMVNVLLIFAVCLAALAPANAAEVIDCDPVIDAMLDELKDQKDCQAIKMEESKNKIMMVQVTLYDGTVYNMNQGTREGHCTMTETNGKFTIKSSFGSTKMNSKSKIKIGGMDMKGAMLNVKIGKVVTEVVLDYKPDVDKKPTLVSLKITKLDNVKMTLEGGAKGISNNPIVTAALKFFTTAFKGTIQKMVQKIAVPAFKTMLQKADLPL